MATTIEQPRRSFLAVAFAGSLLVHLSVLMTAQVVRDRGWLVTQFREQWVRPNDRRPLRDEEESPTPEEEELLQPGIANGVPAVITWIGYEEYVEHLAQEAETEQAAFEMSDVPGVNNDTPAVESSAGGGGGASVEVTTTEVAQSAETSEERETASVQSVRPEVSEAVSARSEEGEVGSVAVAPGDVARSAEANAQREDASVIRTPEAVVEESLEKAIEGSALETGGEDASVAAASGEIVEIAEANAQREDASVQSVRPEDSEAVDATSEEGEDASVVQATGDGEATGNSAPSEPGGADKDSPATSTRKVNEVEWDLGKPLAVEGLEILPYSLSRHILWDSKDILFGQELNDGRWDGRVLRNPIVSLRFNRYGQVGDVQIIRRSGFALLDRRYLVSWMSRWRARDVSLSELPEGGLTAPLVLRIGFIKELKEEEEEGG